MVSERRPRHLQLLRLRRRGHRRRHRSPEDGGEGEEGHEQDAEDEEGEDSVSTATPTNSPPLSSADADSSTSDDSDDDDEEDQLEDDVLKKHGGVGVSHLSKFGYVGPLTKEEDKRVTKKVKEIPEEEVCYCVGPDAPHFHKPPTWFEAWFTRRCRLRTAFALIVVSSAVHLASLALTLSATRYYWDYLHRSPEMLAHIGLEAGASFVALALAFLLAFRHRWRVLCALAFYFVALACLVCLDIVLLVRVLQARYYPTLFVLNFRATYMYSLVVAMLVIHPMLGAAVVAFSCLYLQTVMTI